MPSGTGLDNHQLAALVAIVIVNMVVVLHSANQSNNKQEDMRGRNSSNLSNKRRKFDHQGALNCIYRDYLGPTNPLHGSQFKLQFQMSLLRFDRLFTDLMATPADKFPFFKVNETITGNDVCGFYSNQTASSFENICIWCCISCILSITFLVLCHLPISVAESSIL
jgi:hypothetical protein